MPDTSHLMSKRHSEHTHQNIQLILLTLIITGLSAIHQYKQVPIIDVNLTNRFISRRQIDALSRIRK